MLAAVAFTRAAVRPDRRAIGSEPALCFGAPVCRRVVLVVERELVGIWTRGDEHAFVPDVQAVHAALQLGRSQVIHKNPVVLRSAFDVLNGERRTTNDELRTSMPF